MADSSESDRYAPLVREIFPHARLLRAWSLTGGISAGMTALESVLPDGQTKKWVVRQPNKITLQRNPHAARDEFNLLQLTRSVGLPTPAPVYLDENGKILPSSGLVLDFIEGQTSFALSNLDDTIPQLAANLACIHSVPWYFLEKATTLRPAHALPDLISNRPVILDHSLNEGHIREVLEIAWPLPQRNPSSLLHGDYWPGNVLWQGNQLAAVIDWEDASYGDPLNHLAISRLDIVWIFGRAAMHAFTRHYQACLAVDLTDLPYWDLFAALRLIRLAGTDLAKWAAFFQPYGRSDITEQTIRQHFKYFITQALEKL